MPKIFRAMKTNMGGMDKFIRFMLGMVGGLLVYYSVITGPWSYILLTAVAVLFLTSITGFCPLYGALGISSYKRRPHIHQ